MRSDKRNIILFLSILGLTLCLFACDDAEKQKKQDAVSVVQKKISLPSVSDKPENMTKKAEPIPKETIEIKTEKKVQTQAVPEMKSLPGLNKKVVIALPDTSTQKLKNYNALGKIDPFKPLIQEKSEELESVFPPKPKRILTPLEKIDLSQVRLVAVIIVPGSNKHIAMVEEASGKGYEVSIGTYIGKKQGRVSEIKDSSIIVKELYKDYKGRIKEKFQEIKLHKNNGE